MTLREKVHNAHCDDIDHVGWRVKCNGPCVKCLDTIIKCVVEECAKVAVECLDGYIDDPIKSHLILMLRRLAEGE